MQKTVLHLLLGGVNPRRGNSFNLLIQGHYVAMYNLKGFQDDLCTSVLPLCCKTKQETVKGAKRLLCTKSSSIVFLAQ